LGAVALLLYLQYLGAVDVAAACWMLLLGIAAAAGGAAVAAAVVRGLNSYCQSHVLM